MPQSYTCLHSHIIFSTKNRHQLITPDLQQRLYDYIGGIVTNQMGRLISAGGTADRAHLLTSLSPQIVLSDMLQVVKTNSSKWVHETFPANRKFGWQDGYSAFAVSFSNVERVQQYIAGQTHHHRRVSFQEELLEFLKRHGVDYDERYIWT